MKKNILTGIMVVFFFAVAMGCPVVTYADWGDIIIESEWGFGDNEALMVIDFSPGNGQDDSFAFLGKFSAASIGDFDLFDIVANDPNLSYSDNSGMMMDIYYHDPDTGIDYEGVTPLPGWEYSWWISTKEYPEDDWGYDRTMTDGNITGWCFTEYEVWGMMPPVIPSAVPVPGAVWLLVSGFVGVIGIMRRRAV